jgi:SAM-dependent methyltransferase
MSRSSARATTLRRMQDDRQWEPIVPAGLERLLPPRSMWITPHESFVHYSRWIWEWRVYLTACAGLKRTERVLEIGCNHGRTMLGLLEYLRDPGGYAGFDIQRQQVEYAQQNVSGANCVVQFHYAPVHNPHYNPDGTVPADRYRFGFDDGTFDVCYAASVFTHMLSAATANYLRETARVLRPGGRALYSFFLLDRYRGPGTTDGEAYRYDHELPGEDGVRVIDPEHPEYYVAFSRAKLAEMAAAAGLEVTREFPGSWSGDDAGGISEQDLVLLTRP